MRISPPFGSQNALSRQECNPSASLGHTNCPVPDQPTIKDCDLAVKAFLEKELNTAVLDDMYDWLWVCAAKAGDRIDPLHQQIIKGRMILPAEDPALHLVWFRDTICVKPIPMALLNHEFWTKYLSGDERHFNREVPLGFLRSYGHLIQHRSDLKLALNLNLIPEGIDWLEWQTFIEPFRHLGESKVAKRYHYGQLRLSRLNLLIRFRRPRGHDSRGNNRHYFPMHWYTAAYLKQFVSPGLFVFTSVSLLLSAMQVILSLPDAPNTRTWIMKSTSISFACWGFCVFVLVVLAISWLLLLLGPVVYIIAQQIFGRSMKEEFDKKLRDLSKHQKREV